VQVINAQINVYLRKQTMPGILYGESCNFGILVVYYNLSSFGKCETWDQYCMKFEQSYIYNEQAGGHANLML
jgi:hypothetical protein